MALRTKSARLCNVCHRYFFIFHHFYTLINTILRKILLRSHLNNFLEKLKALISKSATIKSNMLNKILLIDNDNCRTALIGRYIELKSVTEIAKEIYVTRQGVYYHLAVGKKEIEKLI